MYKASRAYQAYGNNTHNLTRGNQMLRTEIEELVNAVKNLTKKLKDKDEYIGQLEHALKVQDDRLVENRELLETIYSDLVECAGASGGLAKPLVELLKRYSIQTGDRKNKTAVHEHVHKYFGEFLHRLQATCPSLTKTELTVCALIRESMTTKNVASKLYNSVRTVEKHRQNIRNKLLVPKSLSLSAFLGII